MKLIEAMAKENYRISNGNETWLTVYKKYKDHPYNEEFDYTFVVYQRKFKKRNTQILIETFDEELAVKKLIEEK